MRTKRQILEDIEQAGRDLDNPNVIADLRTKQLVQEKIKRLNAELTDYDVALLSGTLSNNSNDNAKQKTHSTFDSVSLLFILAVVFIVIPVLLLMIWIIYHAFRFNAFLGLFLSYIVYATLKGARDVFWNK